MKYRKILLILAITILSLTACKKEENPASVENTTIEETTIEETATDSKTDDNMDTLTNADRGAAVGDVVDNTQEESNNPYSDYTKTDDSLADYEVTITETLDLQLYVIKDSNILKLDQEGAGAIAPAEFGVHLTVTGKTQNNWYQIDWAGTKGYLPAEVLSDTNPAPETSQDPSEVIADDGRTAQEILDAYKEATGGMGDILNEEFGAPGEVQNMGPITEGNGYNSNW